jgi:hypothetical protein|tara:strand:+ start:929 stop:1279 length:351 start_codon:yes stop_codon:yes gene_type:complete
MAQKSVKQILSNFLYELDVDMYQSDVEADRLIKQLTYNGYEIPGVQIASSIMMNKYAARVKEDEPIFFLLGHDAQAPNAIRTWAAHRMQAEGPSKQIDRSLEIADEMEAYQRSHIK